MDRPENEEELIDWVMTRLTTGESTSERFPLPGFPDTELHYYLDPEFPAAIRMDAESPEEGRIEAVQFLEVETKPIGFPDGFPFVPGCYVTWTRLPDQEESVHWAVDDDADALFDLVTSSMVDEGWLAVEEDLPLLYEGVLRQSVLAKGSRLRIITLGARRPRGLVAVLECGLDGPKPPSSLQGRPGAPRV